MGVQTDDGAPQRRGEVKNGTDLADDSGSARQQAGQSPDIEEGRKNGPGNGPGKRGSACALLLAPGAEDNGVAPASQCLTQCDPVWVFEFQIGF